MVDASKAAVAKRMQILQEETGATLEALGHAGGGVSPQAASKWLKTGRMGQPAMNGVANEYGYSFLWILTGQGPKRPQDIQDAPVAGPGVPEETRGRHIIQSALMHRAHGLAQAVIDAAERGQMDDAAIAAMESELQRLVANVEAAREAGIRIAAERSLRELEEEQGTRVPDTEREEMIRDIAGRIRAKYEDRKGNEGGSSEGISASRSEGQRS